MRYSTHHKNYQTQNTHKNELRILRLYKRKRIKKHTKNNRKLPIYKIKYK